MMRKTLLCLLATSKEGRIPEALFGFYLYEKEHADVALFDAVSEKLGKNTADRAPGGMQP